MRAYGGAAEACLRDAPVVVMEAKALMSVRYTPVDTGTVYQRLAAYSPSTVDEGAAGGDGVTLETSFEAPPEAAASIARELRSATAGRIEGVWTASDDEDWPFPQFVEG